MRSGSFSSGATAFGLALAVAMPLGMAQAAPSDAPGSAYPRARIIHLARSGGLQCVPFARDSSGIQIVGNAATWWSSAAGVYERGANPEVGSVLNFRANGRMRLGHVAVVTSVINPRTIEIDHANWAGPGGRGGQIARNIVVIDVSQRNDWSAVRVALADGEKFGSIYPTYGFIYDRPDRGVMVANAVTTPAPLLDAAPRDLRPASERSRYAIAAQDAEEVAEADDVSHRRASPAVRALRPLGTQVGARRSKLNPAALPMPKRLLIEFNSGSFAGG